MKGITATMTTVTTDDVSTGITGFIDILGFSKKIECATDISHINDIRRLIEKVQSEFDFDTKDELIQEVHQISNKSVLAFSDCVVINIPLESKATEYSGSFDPFLCELTGFAYAQGTCASDGLFLRGGLDIGWWFQSGTTLISSSMVGAYKAETKAVVPVISVTDDLYTYFANHKDRKLYAPDYDPIKNCLRKYVNNLGEKPLEYWYLDYITICLKDLGWQTSKKQREKYISSCAEEKNSIMSDGWKINVDAWLSNHARKIETAHNDTDDSKVKLKYKWLSEYHNDVAKDFTDTVSCFCSKF
ncbi:MAG: hypothetical protein ACOYL3_10415 [Desulfuromonadaceae bacterium]